MKHLCTKTIAIFYFQKNSALLSTLLFWCIPALATTTVSPTPSSSISPAFTLAHRSVSAILTPTIHAVHNQVELQVSDSSDTDSPPHKQRSCCDHACKRGRAMVSAAVNTGIHYGAAACRKITRVFSVPKPRVLVSESGGVYLQQIVDQTVNDVLTNSELCCPNEMIHWHCLSTEIALQAMVTSHLHDFPVEVSDFTESFVAQYHWELPFEWNLLHWLNTVSYTVYESIPYIDINLETIAAAPMLLITGAEQTHILIFNHPAEEPGDEISMIHDLVSGEEITVPYDELLDLVEDLLGDSVEYTVIVAEGIQNEATDDSDLTGSL